MRRWFVIGMSAFACLPEPKMGSQERDTRADVADMEREPGEDPGGPYADADERPRHDAPPGDDVAGPDDAAAPEDGLIEDEGMDPGYADVLDDAGNPIATDDGVIEDDCAVLDDGVGQDEGLDLSRETLPADANVPDVEWPDTEVPTGTLRHLGWFGPGGVVTAKGVSGLGSLSGPQQAWQVK